MPAPNFNPHRIWAIFGPFSTFGPTCAPPEKLEILKIVLRVRKHVVITYVTQFFIKKHKKCRFEAQQSSIFIDFHIKFRGAHRGPRKF